MPELPEVQTTVNGLNKTSKGKKIVDVWTDIAVETPSLPHHSYTTKSTAFFKDFKKAICGATILKAERRGKNILIHLSNRKTIWIHMKMTGHMMYGSYEYSKKANSWVPSENEKNKALKDPFNRFLHTVFTLSDNKQLVLSDVRKFAKVTLIETIDIENEFKDIGPEPLDEKFSLKDFKEQINKRPFRPIKEVLLDQRLIAGIGNIYSDEMLWLAGINPLRLPKSLSSAEYAKLYKSMKAVLSKGIDFGGDSMSDYRDIYGRKGSFQNEHNAYRKTGDRCKKKSCPGMIAKTTVAGRSTHFCPMHQK